MKNKILILLLIAISLLSCKKDYVPLNTTFQIFNDLKMHINQLEPLYNGTLYEVDVLGVNSRGETVEEYNLGRIGVRRMSQVIAVSPDVVSIRISFKRIPAESDYYQMDTNIRLTTLVVIDLVNEENSIVSVSGVEIPGILDVMEF